MSIEVKFIELPGGVTLQLKEALIKSSNVRIVFINNV